MDNSLKAENKASKLQYTDEYRVSLLLDKLALWNLLFIPLLHMGKHLMYYRILKQVAW